MAYKRNMPTGLIDMRGIALHFGVALSTVYSWRKRDVLREPDQVRGTRNFWTTDILETLFKK